MNTEVWLKDELKSWLQFNDRVIHEASRKDINPIFERLNFLGIADDNLDEFIRTKFKFNKGLRSLIRSQTYAIEDLYETTVSELKEKHGIMLCHASELRDNTKAYKEMKDIFKKDIFQLQTLLMVLVKKILELRN
jgi:polyphosphate kinase